MEIQYSLIADMFPICGSVSALVFLWCASSSLETETRIPRPAISVVGAKAGSEGLKRWDCSQCTTRLFSTGSTALPNSPSFLSAEFTSQAASRIGARARILFCITHA